VPTSIGLLRLYLADPVTDRRGQEITPFFDDPTLNDLLDRVGGDEYAAASEGWRIKAADVAGWVNVDVDNSSFSLSDAHKHAMDMVEMYESLSASSGEFVSVSMKTDYNTSELEGDDMVG
jgi:hypothetical protein